MALALRADHFRNGSCVTSVAYPYGKRNFTEDEGGPFEFGNQVLIPSHRKLPSPKAMVMVRACFKDQRWARGKLLTALVSKLFQSA
jgi:hypothetical protein